MKATYKLQLKQLLASTLLLTAVVGCGQSGPLYLPEETPPLNKAEQPATPDNTEHSTQQEQ
jgi:predicted small lipoprotein YifL